MGLAGLVGKAAVVTGAAGGIGRATALRLAAEGARVLAADIKAEGLAETAAMAAGELHTLVCNVAADDGPAALMAAAQARLGGVSLLFNNAGIGGSHAATDTDDAELDRFLDVNLRAVFRVSREGVKAMGRGGAIVNVASIYGMTGFPGSSAYAAAKAGVIGLTRQMAADCGPRGIRVNAVSPGLIETDMTRRRIQTSAWFTDQMTAMTPLGRNGQPEDIAAGVVFLLSDDASFISGQVLTIDGGWLATRYREAPPA